MKVPIEIIKVLYVILALDIAAYVILMAMIFYHVNISKSPLWGWLGLRSNRAGRPFPRGLWSRFLHFWVYKDLGDRFLEKLFIGVWICSVIGVAILLFVLATAMFRLVG